MATAHIEANKEDISELVLMPGDPLRAKYIAESYLKDVKLVNSIRNMTAYTGYYNDKKITIFPSGMGIPSIGIYSYELFKFYDVKKIIRIGTCGSFNKNIKLRDVILSEGAYCKSYFDQLLDGNDIDYIESSNTLNEKILENSSHLNIPLISGKTITSDVFDLYCDSMSDFEKNFPNHDQYLSCEMEAFGLFYIANKLKKDATCLMTVVDSKYDNGTLTSEDREKSLDDMIILALESI